MDCGKQKIYILRLLRREPLQAKIQAEILGDNIKKIQDKHRVVKRAFYSIFFFCIACISECRNSAQVPFSAKQQSTFDCDRNVMNFVTAAQTKPGPHESTQPRVVPLLCLLKESRFLPERMLSLWQVDFLTRNKKIN